MYCPRCGQQASEEVSFCSRCGLPLDDAAALVEAGGHLAPRPDAPALTPRQRGARKGLLIMAGGFIFFALALLLMTIKQDFFVLMLPAALVFTFGVMRAFYGLLLEDDAARRRPERGRAKLARRASGEREELPPARTRPASDFAKSRADTSDMVAPQSVTEATTTLLEKDS
jgi:hypothetical protein